MPYLIHVSRRVRVFALALAVGLAPGLQFAPPASAADEAVQAAMNLQNAFTEIAEAAANAVVVITNKQIQRPMQGLEQLPPEFRFFFGIPEQPPQPEAEQVPRAAGRGSGFFISEQGFIVTNYHVIEGNQALEIKLRDGTVYDSERDEKVVEVIGVDRETDLAVLRIHDKDREGNFPALRFADSSQVKIGQWAIAVGAPFNFDYSITVGVVSQKGRHDVRVNTYENYIQTDASINPGNSGGPLLNLRGDVIGVNDFIVTGGGMSRGNVGLGFAIASNLANQVAADIMASGSVTRPWIGVSMQTLTPELKTQFNVDGGVLVSDVIDGDPADEAGIKAGDVIVRVGDRKVATPHDLQFAVLRYEPGDKIPITLIRKGKTKTLSIIARKKDVAAAETEEGTDLQDTADLLDKLGLSLQETPQGVAVVGVVPGSKANAADLQRGDLILEVNHTEVESVRDVVKALRETKGRAAVLYVSRRGNKFFVPLRLEKGS